MKRYDLFNKRKLVFEFNTDSGGILYFVQAAAWALRRRRLANSEKEGRWGIASGPTGATSPAEWVREKQDARGLADEFVEQIDALTAEYGSTLSDLLGKLGLCASENLRFLALRLDFNLFYGGVGNDA